MTQSKDDQYRLMLSKRVQNSASLCLKIIEGAVSDLNPNDRWLVSSRITGSLTAHLYKPIIKLYTDLEQESLHNPFNAVESPIQRR